MIAQGSNQINIQKQKKEEENWIDRYTNNRTTGKIIDQRSEKITLRIQPLIVPMSSSSKIRQVNSTNGKKRKKNHHDNDASQGYYA